MRQPSLLLMTPPLGVDADTSPASLGRSDRSFAPQGGSC